MINRIRLRVKEKMISYLNRKSREKVFRHISSDYFFEIKDCKRHYEMLFEDGSITILPKTIFSFIKRWEGKDHPSLYVGKSTYTQNLKLDTFYEQQVTIGSFCSFGPNVVIKPDGVRGKVQFTQYPLFLIDKSSEVYHAEIKKIRNYSVKIGNDCFIGENSKIMANVIVGDGVIIGERSLITNGKILEPFGIYAGIPAKLIGYRYKSEIITELMRLKWWHWPLSKIQESGLQHIDFTKDTKNILDFLKNITDEPDLVLR